MFGKPSSKDSLLSVSNWNHQFKRVWMSLWNKIRSLLDLFNPTADPLYSWKETRKSNGYSRSKKEKTSTSPLLYLASFSQLFNKQAVKFIRHVSSEITPISRKPENSQPLLLLSHFSTRSAIVNSSESSQMHEETNCLEVESSQYLHLWARTSY